LESAGYRPSAVLLLQPTSPLRRPEHIRKALSLLGAKDAVCSLTPLPKGLCPHYLARITDDGFFDRFMPDARQYTRRHGAPQAYVRDGTICLTRVETLRADRDFYGRRCVPMVLRPEDSINLDEPDDWDRAERILTGRRDRE